MKKVGFYKKTRIYPETPNITSKGIEDLINYYSNSGAYNGGRLAEAHKIYEKMIQEDAAICLTLSGATPSEAVSWKKIKPNDVKNDVVVYCDVTIAAPLLFSYILSKKHKRSLKRLYTKRAGYLDKLKDAYNK